MKTMMVMLASSSFLVLGACETVQGYMSGDRDDVAISADDETVSQPVTEAVETTEKPAEAMAEPAAEEATMHTAGETLHAVLHAQSDDVKARYGARHPGKTLMFFGIEPGMTVVEALPGGGWYSKILLAYLGPDGTLAGAQYPDEMWAKSLPNPTPENIAAAIESTAGWADTAAEWEIENGAAIKSFQMTKVPEDKAGLVDAVLYIRAMHNMNRADEDHSTFTDAIAESYRLLKPGGVAGVVQHRAPEANSDEWANGQAGYLKQSYVVASFEAAGFVLEEASEINANALDMPSEEDFVWRLPPVRFGTDDDTPERAAIDAIGESDRMTLKFRKPASESMMDAMMEGGMDHKMDHMKDDAAETVTGAVEDAVEEVASDGS